MSFGKLTFDGVDLFTTFGLHISGSGTFDDPERDVESVEVPGRNGSIIIDNGRYKNRDQKYSASIAKDTRETFENNVRGLLDYLSSKHGYCKLADTYHTGYIMARYKGPTSVEPIDSLSGGTFELTFDCKPQRYTADADTVITLAAAGSLSNVTNQTALPLIKVTGTGSFMVGADTVTVTETGVIIDCELMDCYDADGVNKNSTVTIDTFPSLPPGSTGITMTGVTQLDITPRWFTV